MVIYPQWIAPNQWLIWCLDDATGLSDTDHPFRLDATWFFSFSGQTTNQKKTSGAKRLEDLEWSVGSKSLGRLVKSNRKSTVQSPVSSICWEHIPPTRMDQMPKHRRNPRSLKIATVMFRVKTSENPETLVVWSQNVAGQWLPQGPKDGYGASMALSHLPCLSSHRGWRRWGT